MKRLLSCALVLLLALSTMSCALASVHVDNVNLAVRDNDFSIFIGPNNYIYRSDSIASLLDMEARSVLYADMNRLVFSTVDTENQHEFDNGASLLWSYSLIDPDTTPRVFANCIGEAVYVESDAAVYFVPQDDAQQLLAYKPFSGAYDEAIRLEEPILGLQKSVDGLLLYGETRVYLYHAAFQQVTDVTETAPAMNTVQAYSLFETQLDALCNLYLRAKGSQSGVEVDHNVLAVTATNGIVFYLRAADGAVELCAYNYGNNASKKLGTLPEAMLPEMVSDGESTVYMLGSSHTVYRYSAQTGVNERFASLGDALSAPVLCYSAPDLLVYDNGTDAGMPVFVKAIETLPEDRSPKSEDEDVVDEPIAAPTATPAPTKQPTPVEEPADLTKGSRGDEVLRLQQLLHEQGYPVGKPDGVYGGNTVTAVKYLQWDLGVKQTGVVTHAFLEKLLNADDLPTFEKYVRLERGDKGYRVTLLQQRLKDLGWLTGKVDGDYGKATETALKNFEKKDGDSPKGVATVSIQKELFAKDAPKYVAPKPTKVPTPAQEHNDSNGKDYIDDDLVIKLTRWMNDNLGDTYGNFDRVHAIKGVQKRLVQLGYMTKKQVSGVYDKTTFVAMKHFQNDNDILPHPSGEPDSKTLGQLFPLSLR